MYYTIGRVSKMFNLPISTLRYYDNQGLFPYMSRENGIRKFSDNELETLRVIDCLKKSGLEIKEIKQFMQWCSIGRETYPLRRQLFINQKAQVEAEIEKLQQVLDMIKFKCWYYETAIKDGGEHNLKDIPPKNMPEDIRTAYKNCHL